MGERGRVTLDSFLALIRNDGPQKTVSRSFHRRNLVGALIPAAFVLVAGTAIKYYMEESGEAERLKAEARRDKQSKKLEEQAKVDAETREKQLAEITSRVAELEVLLKQANEKKVVEKDKGTVPKEKQ